MQYDSVMMAAMTCDGCGQAADAEHVARRLRRLEWATRYRPVHIQALILGSVAPDSDSAYLYAPETAYQGDAGNILRVLGIHTEGKTHDAVLTEFQKLGLMLAYVLECPVDGSPVTVDRIASEDGPHERRPADSAEAGQVGPLLEKQLPTTLARIRRSLRPKRVVLFSAELAGLADRLRREVECSVFPVDGAPFALSPIGRQEEAGAFWEAVHVPPRT
jgi:hypothetical protein